MFSKNKNNLKKGLDSTNACFPMIPCFFGKHAALAAVKDKSHRCDTMIMWGCQLILQRTSLYTAHLNNMHPTEMLSPVGIELYVLAVWDPTIPHCISYYIVYFSSWDIEWINCRESIKLAVAGLVWSLVYSCPGYLCILLASKMWFLI